MGDMCADKAAVLTDGHGCVHMQCRRRKAERCPFRSAWVRSGATKETSPFEGAAAAVEAAS